MKTEITNLNSHVNFRRHVTLRWKTVVLFLVTLLIFTNLHSQQWYVDHIASELDGSVLRPMSTGSYDLEANKTFVAFLGENSHIYIMECDHNNGNQWSEPIKIADCPTSMSAKYAYPQLVQTPDGYIHVFFAKHTTNIWYARSSEPHNPTSWVIRDLTREVAEGSPDFTKLRPAYPKVLLGRDGFIYLFWRQSTDLDYQRYASFTYSKDAGKTWEPARFLITPVRDDLLNETYVGQINIEPKREGVPERFHFVYILAGGPGGHNQYHKNLYHAIWQPGDRNFYSLKGDNLGPVLDSHEMDSYDCLVLPTETAKDAIGYTHTVGINDQGMPIVDARWVYNGTDWVESGGANQLDIDNNAFLQWVDDRMLAYGDRFSLWESDDMGNSWTQLASVNAPTGNAGVSETTIPITKPAHPAAQVWIKEQKIAENFNNHLSIAGQTTDLVAKKIILKANYPSIPKGGKCTVQAFITNHYNARVSNASNAITFTIEGNGTLESTKVNAVNGLAAVEFTATDDDEVVVIRATGEGLDEDYIEVFVGNGIIDNDIVGIDIGKYESIQDDIKIYPNPITSQFNIKSSKEATMRIVDLNGKILRYEKIVKGNNTVMTNMKSGIYFVQLLSDGNTKMYSKKIIVK